MQFKLHAKATNAFEGQPVDARACTLQFTEVVGESVGYGASSLTLYVTHAEASTYEIGDLCEFNLIPA